MAKIKFDRESGTENRIDFLERLMQSLMRRHGNKKISAVFTPYPISSAIFSDQVIGVVMRYMFPCSGKIIKGVIEFGNKPKNIVSVIIDIRNEVTGTSQSIYTDSKKKIFDLNIHINECDKLTMSIIYKTEKEEDNITELWTSLLWVPTIKSAEIKNFLIGELENDIVEE